MTQTEVIEILRGYKELLSKYMDFEFLILFGSYTRRKANRE